MDSDAFARLLLLEKECQLGNSMVRKLYRTYCKIDNDHSGTISIGEFMAFFDVYPTPFGERVFSIMDTDLSGKLDFVEFIGSVLNYCSYDARQLMQYAFTIFDGDESGILDMAEVNQLVEYVYGDKLDDKVKTILKGLDKNGDGTISFAEFAVSTLVGFAVMI